MLRVLFVLLCLPACAMVSPGASALFQGFDPRTADPAGYEVALHVPEGVRVTETVLSLSATRAVADDDITQAVVLVKSDAPSGSPDAPLPGVGQSAVYFRVGAEDASRIQAMQAQIQAWEAADGVAPKGSLSVTTTACLDGKGPAQDATGSVFLRASTGMSFAPVIRNAALRDVFEAIAPLATCVSQ